MNIDPANSQSDSAVPSPGPTPGGMPLIVTKIRVPRRRPELLSRRRLVDYIHTHLDRKLILISAPAGYGKTSLLTDWAHETDLPVCWYTLDSFDGDLSVFLDHLIGAIALRFPAFGQRSRAFVQGLADPGRHIYPIVATLVQEIYDLIPEYFVVVLDDLHAVEEQEKVNEFLDLLVTYVDENCHFVFASRTLPALPNLSLLLARRQAAGLSIDELRFTPPEIEALALQNYGLELDAAQVQALAEWTEGWVTGLLLTAARGWEQSQARAFLPGRINSDLYDYLSRQVLDQQPAPLRDFLLASSVLDEISPDLCAEVLGVERPANSMDQVRTRNLFWVEFEGAGDRLRYHQLFREFLQTSLRRQDDARFRALTRRTAEAYAKRGLWDQAVSRYLALQDYACIIALVEQLAAELYAAGRWDTLAGWIDALPAPVLSEQPRLLVYRADIHLERGEHARALPLYDQAIQAFHNTDQDQVAFILAQKSGALRVQGHYKEALAQSRQALDLAGGNRSTRGLAYKNVGLCQFALGQVAEGLQSLRQSLTLYEELQDSYDAAMVHQDLGMGYDLIGHLEAAVEHYQAALAIWRRLGTPGPWAHTLNNLSVIHYLRGEYDQALELLNEALVKVRQAGNLRVEAAIWASLGDVHRDRGAYEQARQAYADGLEVATRAGEGFIVTYTLDALGNSARLRGDLKVARKRLSAALERAQDHVSTYELGLCHMSLGILANEEHDPATALDHLGRATEHFEAGGYMRELARAWLHHAQACFMAGDEARALAGLDRALALATQLELDQFLVVDGQRLMPLFSLGLERGVGRGVLPGLLERIRAYHARLAEQPEPALRAESRPVLRVFALGQPRVEMDGKTVQWATTQSRDLFFCLRQHPEGLRREQIGTMFWPDHAPNKLESIFRSTLYRLRRALFRDSVSFEDGVYHLSRPPGYECDVETFERLLDQAEQSQATEDKTITWLEQALELYSGDYVQDVYGDWCETERERLHTRYLAALDRLSELYAQRGKLQRAIELYQVALARDPYQETAYRGLMRCYLRLGDRASAVQQYQACAKVLRGLGVRPMPETEELYDQISR